MAITVLPKWAKIWVLPCTVKLEAQCRDDVICLYFNVIEVMLSKEQ
jgi:hypothetical protein